MIDRKPQPARVVAALTVSLLLGACATTSATKPRLVVGPAYPFMQFDAQRTLLAEAIAYTGPATRWRFVDSARHTSTAFPSGAGIQYMTFRSDNPDTIVIYAGQNAVARCTSGVAKGQACPRLYILLSTDGGQHFLRREIDLPALTHSISNNSGRHGGTPRLPVPAMVVERGILYVAAGGDAKPLVRVNGWPGGMTVLSTGEVVEHTTPLGRAYTWPEGIEVRRPIDKIGPLKRGPVYLFAVALPAATQAPPDEPATGDASVADAPVCAYRRMRKASSTLPNLTAVPLVGSRLEQAPALPDFAMPAPMPYSQSDLYQASISETRRGELLDKWRNVYPEWVAAQPPVRKFTPRAMLELSAAKIDCGPDYPSKWD
ncbi:hypothetical protein [Burkholderia contaminans]|uniref:hypothetical protein n=1 Tax=Burkholderia contaminans TaxID=488447 RepID=UPI002D7F75B7|nr:hypothetical protein [Burkholderia contaminans]